MQKQYLENAEHLEKSLNAKLEGLFLVMTLQFFLATLKVGQPFEMKYLRAYIRIIKQLTLFKPGCARLPSGLTFRSSRPAFGGRLSFFVSHHEQIVTLRINRLVMPTTRWVLRNVSPHQVSKHYSLARRKTTRCRTATHTREYCKIIRLAAKPPLGLAPRNRHLRASNLTDAYAF